MNKVEIKKLLSSFANKKDRTIVIVDFGNVDKWQKSLGWRVGIQEMANLVKNFSQGQRYLRRFYYGSDFGPKESSTEQIAWSEAINNRAKMNGFDIVTKKVKYIHSDDNKYGYEKKCDLDVEMTIDLVRERKNYDTIILFSGDGDLMYAINYLYKKYNKDCYVFGARDHIGREVFDAKTSGAVSEILFAEDFEYRISAKRI